MIVALSFMACCWRKALKKFYCEKNSLLWHAVEEKLTIAHFSGYCIFIIVAVFYIFQFARLSGDRRFLAYTDFISRIRFELGGFILKMVSLGQFRRIHRALNAVKWFQNYSRQASFIHLGCKDSKNGQCCNFYFLKNFPKIVRL